MALVPFKSFINLRSTCHISQQFRTVYILKRKYPIMMSKLNDKTFKRLKPKHYIYNLVEDTNVRKAEKFNVLLTSFVEGLGECGDIVSVKPHYARNYLLLPRLAVYPTDDNLKLFEKEIEARKRKETQSYSSPFASVMLKILTKRAVSVTMSATEPWTLEAWHVRMALRQSSIIAPEYAIELPTQTISGPNMENDDKEFAVFVTVNKTEKVPVRCRLHHIGSEKNDLWYLEEKEAIFPEQEELLSKMPRPDTITKFKNT